MSYLDKELTKLLNNEKQREAYFHNDHCVVQAGPGSGKTATLTMKIMLLLTEHISPPRGLACVTFNNEALREFKNRLKKLGLPPRPNVFLGTVHSFCLSCVIRPYGRLFRPDIPSPPIVAPEDVQSFCFQQAMDQVGINQSIWKFRERFDRYRRTHLDRMGPEWYEDEECAKTIESYESLLRSKGYLDFDDLILTALNLIESQSVIRLCLQARFPWLVIDEYQDLGYPLHRIVLSLIDNTDVKVYAVGDPDQSIYGYAGASPKYLQQLSAHQSVKPVTLELNYRCGQKIIDGAEVILCPPTPRNFKSSRGESDIGEVYFFQRSEGLKAQAKLITQSILPELHKAGYEPKDTAILYIDRHDARLLIEALNESDIKYVGERDQRYKRTKLTRWIEDVAQWCCGIRGKEGVCFRDVFDFWMGLLADTGTLITEAQQLQQLRTLFEILYSLQDPAMSVEKWLKRNGLIEWIPSCLLPIGYR